MGGVSNLQGIMAEAFAFVGKGKKIDIIFEGQSIRYSNLLIHQELFDVNSFSFIWRRDYPEVTLEKHLEFYEDHLGKEILIEAQCKGGLSFKGLIKSIECFNPYGTNVEYKVEGKGIMSKFTDTLQCNSWTDTTLTQIVDSLATKANCKTEIINIPNHKEILSYTVQYNQSMFDFIAMMAARLGEWFYYDGSKMVLGKSGKDNLTATEVTVGTASVFDVSLHTNAIVPRQEATGFDFDKGESISNTFNPSKFGATTLLDTSVSSGKKLSGLGHKAYMPNPLNQNAIKSTLEKQHEARVAGSVMLNGNTNLPTISLGKEVKLIDFSGAQNSNLFTVIKITHESNDSGHYVNTFTAIPAENKVPPHHLSITNTSATAQLAVVAENEDTEGMSRIKVKFPWQSGKETSPWLNVLTPHAGKDKGFRFLPEVDDIVMVGFLGNNIEKPYVTGAVHSGNQKSGIAEKENNIKTIATKTGRRIVFDEGENKLTIADNFTGKFPVNGFEVLNNKEDEDNNLLRIESAKDQNSGSKIRLNNKKNIEIVLLNGGEETASIKLSEDGKKISIASKGNIDIVSDKKLSLKASEIDMNAQSIKLSANDTIEAESKKDLKLTGLKVDIKSNATLEMKSISSLLEGSGKLELKSTGIAMLTGMPVKIN